jgi:hypothetical protein
MPSNEDETKKSSVDGNRTFADELGVDDLSEPVFGGRGKLFSAAGRDSPIAEFTAEHVLLHAPDKPYNNEKFEDEIANSINRKGILLDEMGNEKRLKGAKFQGKALYCMGVREEQTGKNLVAWFNEKGEPRPIFFGGALVTYDTAIKLRNKTHNGELADVAGVSASPNAQ